MATYEDMGGLLSVTGATLADSAAWDDPSDVDGDDIEPDSRPRGRRRSREVIPPVAWPERRRS